MMLLFKLVHPALTIVAQLAGLMLTGNAWWGGIAALTGFAFREVTQAEYRWLEQLGKPFASAANYAAWHYRTFGQFEGRLPHASWDIYFAANPDLQLEWARLSGVRSKMPWWGGFDPRVWQLHSVLGVVLPAIAMVVTGLVAG